MRAPRLLERPPNAPLLAGAYEPLIELGVSGMASTVLARCVSGHVGHVVMVKEVHRHVIGYENVADVLRAGVRVAARIQHANVVPLIELVDAPNELLLVTEYVESVSLWTLLRTASDARAVLPAPVVSRIVLDMLAGLHAAHEFVDAQGRGLEVVHRDVCPRNVVVGRDGVSRLVDFGVADAKARLASTTVSQLRNTYGYMSPEQIRGDDIDRRSDVFAAATALFEALTGTPLFRTESAFETLQRSVEEPLPDFSRFRAIPPLLGPVLERALDRDRERRFASALDLADALEASVPPAPHRQVAEAVELHCGQQLDERRALLANTKT